MPRLGHGAGDGMSLIEATTDPDTAVRGESSRPVEYGAVGARIF
jgi:hypothetical protein